eukprot:1151681-Pelagomonas_calceolata.AAC.4
MTCRHEGAPAAALMSKQLTALSDLPESFASLPIVDLFLSENEFTRIPRALLGMGQLAKLSMACCKLQEVCFALTLLGMGELAKLCLACCKL